MRIKAITLSLLSLSLVAKHVAWADGEIGSVHSESGIRYTNESTNAALRALVSKVDGAPAGPREREIAGTEHDRLLQKFNEPWDNGKPGVPDFNNALPAYARMQCVSSKRPNRLYHGVFYSFTADDLDANQRELYPKSKVFLNLNMSGVPASQPEEPFKDIAWRAEYKGGAVGHKDTIDDAQVAVGTTRPRFKDKETEREDGSIFYDRTEENGELGKGIAFQNIYYLRLTKNKTYIARRVVRAVDEATGNELWKTDLLCEQAAAKNDQNLVQNSGVNPVPVPAPAPKLSADTATSGSAPGLSPSSPSPYAAFYSPALAALPMIGAMPKPSAATNSVAGSTSGGSNLASLLESPGELTPVPSNTPAPSRDTASAPGPRSVNFPQALNGLHLPGLPGTGLSSGGAPAGMICDGKVCRPAPH